ncbi:hypothetical protein EDC04DRAFT_2579508 [Pisolithus marmoratus]|nr:hypothetical protein EDC04DRAFT_2579508 [Pisolithus marmoratus]
MFRRSYNPIVCTMALISLTYALMSISYGCILYIVQFKTLQSMYKAMKWAQEPHGTTAFICERCGGNVGLVHVHALSPLPLVSSSLICAGP